MSVRVTANQNVENNTISFLCFIKNTNKINKKRMIASPGIVNRPYKKTRWETKK